jgi:hypothetical protein
MELVPDYVEPPPQAPGLRHPIRWTLIVIGAIIVGANWRLVVVSVVIVVIVVILLVLVATFAFVRKMTRPIGQLSTFDVAFIAWVYRRWERMKERHLMNGESFLKR